MSKLAVLAILLGYLLFGIFLAGLLDDNPNNKFEFGLTVIFWPLEIVLILAAIIGYAPYKLGKWLHDEYLKFM